MNKFVITGIFALIFFVGLGLIVTNENAGLTDLLRWVSDSGPRVLSILALPFIAILFVLGIYLRKKNEERKWKQALKKTRAKKNTSA